VVAASLSEGGIELREELMISVMSVERQSECGNECKVDSP